MGSLQLAYIAIQVRAIFIFTLYNVKKLSQWYHEE